MVRSGILFGESVFYNVLRSSLWGLRTPEGFKSYLWRIIRISERFLELFVRIRLSEC